MKQPIIARLALGLAFLFLATTALAQSVTVEVNFDSGVSPVENLQAISVDGAVLLDWDDSADPETIGYALYRLDDSNQFQRYYNDPLTESAFEDSNVESGAIYVYGVAALAQPESCLMSQFAFGQGWRFIPARVESASAPGDSVPAFDPAEDDSLALWLDGKVDCAPALWEDQGPLNLQFAQATSEERPTARVGGGLVFDGTQSLAAPDGSALALVDVFVVAKVGDLAGASRALMWCQDGESGFDFLDLSVLDGEAASGLPAYANKVYPSGGSILHGMDIEASGLDPNLIAAAMPAEGVICFLRYSASNGPADIVGALAMGSASSSGAPAFLGEILEIIVFDEIKTRQEVIGLYEYAVAKWAMPAIPDYSGAPPAPFDVAGGEYFPLLGGYAQISFEPQAPVDLLGWRLKRRVGGSGAFTQIGDDPTDLNAGTAGLGQPIYLQDDTIDPEEAAQYQYIITALDIFGRESAAAGPVTLAAPPTPTGLAATPGVERASLTWSGGGIGGANGYNVYRSTTSSSGPWTKLNAEPLSIASPSYMDTDLSPEQTVWYRITSQSAPGLESDPSTAIEVTTYAAIVSPIRSSDIILDLGTEAGDFTETSGVIDAWLDASAADNDFTQSSAANKPDLVDLGGGAGNVVQFDTTPSANRLNGVAGLLTQDLSGADGWTLFFRAKITTHPTLNTVATIFQVLIGRSASVDRVGISVSVLGVNSSGAKVRVSTQPTTTTAPITVSSVAVDWTERALYSISVKFGDANNGVMKVRRNGQVILETTVLDFAANTWTPGGTPPTTVDFIQTTTTISTMQLGPGEFLLYKGDSTDEELAQMEDLLGF